MLTGLVIEGFYHLPECTTSQPLEQLISIPNLLMLFPEVASLQVVFPYSCTDSYIIDSLFIDELNSLVFGKDGLEFLQDFLAWQSGK